MTSRHPVIDQLAGEHAGHVAWLRARAGGRLDRDEAEEAMQGAYAKALESLRGPRAPSFADLDAARGWLRTIAYRTAVDAHRRSRHRLGSGSASPALGRPRPAGREPDAGVDVEADAMASLERRDHRRLVSDALGELTPEQRQLLQLRYGRGLDPAAIMLLQRLRPRQWDGRHERAVRALGRALAQRQPTADCRRTRRLLRRSPGALLDPDAGADTRAHVTTCLACGAFARCTRAALAAAPLPMTVEAWRLRALEHMRLHPATGGRAGRAPASGVRDLVVVARHGLAAAAAAIALAVGGAVSAAGEGEREVGATHARPQPPVTRARAVWADHAAPVAAPRRLDLGVRPGRAQAVGRTARARPGSPRRTAWPAEARANP